MTDDYPKGITADDLMPGILRYESGSDENPRGDDFAVSPTGAIGAYQIEPSTARRFGYRPDEMFVRRKNEDVARKYLTWLLNHYQGDPYNTIAGYNTGEANVDADQIPEETNTYANNVLRYKDVTANLERRRHPAPAATAPEAPKPVPQAAGPPGIDYEDALQRLQQSEMLTRGQAIDRLREATNAGDPEAAKVKNVPWLKERAKSIFLRGATGVAEGILDIPEAGARLAKSKLPSSIGEPIASVMEFPERAIFGTEDVGQKMSQAAAAQTETTWGAEGLGMMAGSAAPFGMTEDALAGVSDVFAAHPLVRRTAAGALLGYWDTGTLKGAEWGGVGAAVLPPVIEAVAGTTANLVSKGAARAEVAVRGPTYDIPETPQDIFGRPTGAPDIQQKGTTVADLPERGPVETPESNINAVPSGSVFGRGAADPITLPPEAAVLDSPDATHVGTRDIKTGEPFSGERTVLLQGTVAGGRVFVPGDSPHASMGKTGRVELTNPLVVEVGTDPYRDAIQKLIPESDKLLEDYDRSQSPYDFAREVLGRFAKGKKHDGVILRGKDPKNDIILNYKGFKQSDVRRKAAIGGIRQAPKPPPIFGRGATPVEPEVSTKNPEVVPEDVYNQHLQEATARSEEDRLRETEAKIKAATEQAARETAYRQKFRESLTTPPEAAAEPEPEPGSLEYLQRELEKQQREGRVKTAEREGRIDWRGEVSYEPTEEKEPTQEEIDEKARKLMEKPKPSDPGGQAKLDFPSSDIYSVAWDIQAGKIDEEMAGRLLYGKFGGKGPFDVLNSRGIRYMMGMGEPVPASTYTDDKGGVHNIPAKPGFDMGKVIQEWDRSAGHEPEQFVRPKKIQSFGADTEELEARGKSEPKGFTKGDSVMYKGRQGTVRTIMRPADKPKAWPLFLVDFPDGTKVAVFERDLERPTPMVGGAEPGAELEVGPYHGFASEDEMGTAIRAAQLSPFEMLRAGGKTIGKQFAGKFTARVGAGGLRSIDITRADFNDFYPELGDAFQVFLDRHPYLGDELSEFGVRSTGQEGVPSTSIAVTQRLGKTGRIRMYFNSDHFDSIKKLWPDDFRDGLIEILEHEFTHVAQYWADASGRGGQRSLAGTFGLPTKDLYGVASGGLAQDVREAVEEQAYKRQGQFHNMMLAHRDLQARVDAIPDDVKNKYYRADIKTEQDKMRPYFTRRVNQRADIPARMQTFAAEKIGDLKPEDLDLFDQSSRDLPIGQMADPDKVMDPNIKKFIDLMSRHGLKTGAQIRLPFDVSDSPSHLGFISRIYKLANEKIVMRRRFDRTLTNIFKEYGVDKGSYDKLFEAVEGLRRQPDGTLTQTAPNVDEKTQRAAVRMRNEFTDRAYTYLTGVDSKAPAILKSMGLSDSPGQLLRIKMIQSGLRHMVKDPTLSEFTAASKLDGMLNFDESHDLRGQFVDGYLTHQPIANERAKILDDIGQIDAIMKMTGANTPSGGQAYKDFASAQAMRQTRLKRLEEIELGLARQKVRSLPARDMLPTKHFFGPFNVKDNPTAAEILVDKDIPSIAGRYVDGIINKRFFDAALHEFRKVKDQLPPSVRDYDINYLNNLRGVRGFREDQAISQLVNGFNKLTSRAARVTTQGVRQNVSELMQWTNMLKLGLSPVRFPLILTTHFGMTTMPVAGFKASGEGLAYFFSNPKQAIMECMARGVIDRDSEFQGAIDGVRPTTQGALLKYGQILQRYPDYFRKAASWHTFRIQAEKPDFEPSPLATTFQKNVPGRNRIQMAREYADAMTDRTQFRMRQEGKSQVFVGGTARRLAGQFKSWPVNLGTLYKDIIRTKDTAMIGRTLGALAFFGGATALTGGQLLYDPIRHELLKHGIIIPQETGWQMVANQLGIGSHLEDIDIMSLRDPIGLPRSADEIVPWVGGPVVGSVYDAVKDFNAAQGDPGKEVKSLISAVSPQLRAGVDAVEEARHGGIQSETGRTLATRSPASIIIRGLDLSPSMKSQRYNYMNDIITAYESGHPETAQQLMTQARAKGVIFGSKDSALIRSKVKQYRQMHARYAADPERLLQ